VGGIIGSRKRVSSAPCGRAPVFYLERTLGRAPFAPRGRFLAIMFDARPQSGSRLGPHDVPSVTRKRPFQGTRGPCALSRPRQVRATARAPERSPKRRMRPSLRILQRMGEVMSAESCISLRMLLVHHPTTVTHHSRRAL
jgi:hypothetical protein